MNTLTAKAALSDIISAAKLLVTKAQQLGAIIEIAQREDRDLTEEEMERIIHEDEPAKIAVNAAILRSIK